MQNNRDIIKRTKFYIFDCKNDKLKRILIVIFCVAAVLEALVKTQAFEFLELLLGFEIFLPILLSSDYLNEVFAATCTVAVLGNAILSILFGVYDKKTLGVPFQDVLNHSLVGSEQKFTIEALSASIIFSLLWYVLGCYNLLFSVLIADVFLLVFSCEDLWRFLSDKEMQRKTIIDIINEVDSSRYAVYVDNWFKELNEALVPNNSKEAQEYFNLIAIVMDCDSESADQIKSCVGLHLQPYFNTACEKLGFVEAFRLLAEAIKYAHDDGTLDKRIALKYLERLKSKDQVDIANYEVSDLLIGIFQDSQFIDSDKMLYAYQYFCAIFDNYQMNTEAKYNKIDEILCYFCDLQDPDYGIYKAKLIMNIVKYKILDNDDVINRKKLFCALIEALKQENFVSSKLYIQTISEIFRAFFFVIYLEDGSLTEKYRSELLSLFHTVTKDKDLVSLSFMSLVKEHIEDVVYWLALDSVSHGEKPRGFWDYRSLAMSWKKMVWTADEVISFAFCVCHSISTDMDAHEFYIILESDEFSSQEKVFICKTLLSQYGSEGFSNELVNRSLQISEFCQMQVSIRSSFWTQEHDYYQEKLIDLETALNNDYLTESELRNADIWKGVQEIFDHTGLFVYDSSFSLFPGNRITFLPTYEYAYKNFWPNAAKRVSDKVRKYLCENLKDILPSLPVNFKMEGVRELLSELEGNSYKYRNFKYTDDWGLKASIRNTPEYQKLSEILDHISYDGSQQIPVRVFLKKDKIPFNFYLQYDIRYPSDDECEDYAKRHMQDGICTIGGYRLDYEHAKEYVKKNVLIENVTIFIHVSLESNEGFQIQIKHK